MATEGVRIDELDPTLAPSFAHLLPAMDQGQTTKLSVQQIADLLNANAEAATMWVGTDPPTPPTANGALWFESDSGNTYVYYDDGNSQQWVQMNVPAMTPTGFTGAKRQIITTSGPITLDPRTAVFQVEVQGPGGGGGPCFNPASAQGSASGGGAAGGYCSKWITKPAGAFNPVATIGSGGGSGVDGGNSSYSDGINTLTANGGKLGVTGGATVIGSWSGGAGGSASGGEVTKAGDAGGWSIVNSASGYVLARGGWGANSRFGSGGASFGITNNVAQGSAGGAGIGYGSGGGGASSVFAGGSLAGGAGAPGCVIISEFY